MISDSTVRASSPEIDSATAPATRENSVAGHMNRAAGQAVGLINDCAARAISSAA